MKLLDDIDNSRSNSRL